MEEKKNTWKLGEKADFPFTSTEFKKSGSFFKTFYKHFYSSRFICIREETDEQPGILLKVLGRTSPKDIIIVGGEPFCKDEKEEMISGRTYASYRFPTIKQVSEVVEILRENRWLKDLLENSEMHINLQAYFWVRNVAGGFLFGKKPRYFDPESKTLYTVSDKTPHYRLAVVYFHKGELTF